MTGVSELPVNFLGLLSAKDFSDAFIVMGENTIYLHQCILYVRAKEFLEFFTEDNQFTYNISDNYTYDIVYQAIRLIYSDYCTVPLTQQAQFTEFLQKHTIHRFQQIVNEDIDIPLDEQPQTTLATDLANLLKQSYKYDFTFRFENDEREIKAHKAILLSRCNHFKTMFMSFAERESPELRLHGITYEVFSHVIEHIYTDNSNISVDVVVDVLDAANLYEIDSLKRNCSEKIIGNLECDNVLVLLERAVKYECHALKTACIDFIVDNFSEVFRTQDYNDMPVNLRPLIHMFL